MRKSLFSNHQGQFVIEAVLLMVVMLSLFVAGTNALRDGNFMAKLVSTPWEKVSGMIEAGVWDTPAAAQKKHPNQINRSVSVDPNQI